MVTKGYFIEVSLLLLISLVNGFQQRELKPTVSPSFSKATSDERNGKRLDSGDLLKEDRTLSAAQLADFTGNNGLTEVKENEIPEGSLVYVLEEPMDQPADGEILKTASNIVFRPLFRYRGKIEAQRRNSNRIRRRYFVPSRSYRQTYHTPYYGHRYYK